MSDQDQQYLPAATFDVLLPLYDPLVKLAMRDEETRGELIRRANIERGHDVLDLGCGTGALSVLIMRRHPLTQLTALDPDLKALARARGKAADAGYVFRIERGFGDKLRYPDESFDRVISSLVLHHLTRAEKMATLREVRRVLRPDGSFHVLDFGVPQTRIERWLTLPIHHGERMQDNLEGRLPAMMQEAGFAAARESGSVRTIIGRLSIIEARCE